MNKQKNTKFFKEKYNINKKFNIKNLNIKENNYNLNYNIAGAFNWLKNYNNSCRYDSFLT